MTPEYVWRRQQLSSLDVKYWDLGLMGNGGTWKSKSLERRAKGNAQRKAEE